MQAPKRHERFGLVQLRGVSHGHDCPPLQGCCRTCSHCIHLHAPCAHSVCHAVVVLLAFQHTCIGVKDDDVHCTQGYVSDIMEYLVYYAQIIMFFLVAHCGYHILIHEDVDPHPAVQDGEREPGSEADLPDCGGLFHLLGTI